MRNIITIAVNSHPLQEDIYRHMGILSWSMRICSLSSYYLIELFSLSKCRKEIQPQTFSFDLAQPLDLLKGTHIQIFRPSEHHMFGQSVVIHRTDIAWWNHMPFRSYYIVITLKEFSYKFQLHVTACWLYLPNHLNRVIKVWVSNQRISDAPITICCDDAHSN